MPRLEVGNAAGQRIRSAVAVVVEGIILAFTLTALTRRGARGAGSYAYSMGRAGAGALAAPEGTQRGPSAHRPGALLVAMHHCTTAPLLCSLQVHAIESALCRCRHVMFADGMSIE